MCPGPAAAAVRPWPYTHAMDTTSVTVRAATPEDLRFVLGLVPRLTEFGAPPWRPAEAIEADSAASLAEALESAGEEGAVLVAEDRDGERLGVVHVEVEADYITGEERAFVGDLIVTRESEGKGVARALMAAAEAWARARGLGSLTLYVFAGDRRARDFYARLGFLEDGLRLMLPLEEREAS